MQIQIGDQVIRSWRLDDAERVAQYANNRNISKNLRDVFPFPYTLDDAKSYLDFVTRADPETDFAIANEDGVIGGIGLTPGRDVHRKTAEVGYWLAEPFWGQGIMSRAVGAFVEWAFREFDLCRVFADPFVANPGSAKVLEKNGFVLEGIKRCSVIKDGIVHDQFLYARTRPGLESWMKVEA